MNDDLIAEKILDDRLNAEKHFQYLIKWKDNIADHATWESYYEISTKWAKLIEEYERSKSNGIIIMKSKPQKYKNEKQIGILKTNNDSIQCRRISSTKISNSKKCINIINKKETMTLKAKKCNNDDKIESQRKKKN